MQNKKEYYYHIESLRAISLLFVLLYYYYPKLFPFGFLGVDIFFVISGFVISLTISKTNSTLKEYLIFSAKRINRLFPKLNIVYIFILVFGIFFLTKNEYFGNFVQVLRPVGIKL
jgi:peptidoglycan/LPS O-acetylase OafA/YrhL